MNKEQAIAALKEQGINNPTAAEIKAFMETNVKPSVKIVSAPDNVRFNLERMKQDDRYVVAGQPGSLSIEEGEEVSATVLRYVGELNLAQGTSRKDGTPRSKGFYGLIYLVKTVDGKTGTILTDQPELPTSVTLKGVKQGENINAVIVG